MRLAKRVWPLGVFESLAIALFLSAAAPAARAQLQFSGPVNYAAGTSPSIVVTGDFNGDGKLDQAVLNTGDHTVSILLGNGDGTFQPAINSPVGSSAGFMAAGDFNGDGKLDLVVANGSANTVSVMLGDGDGTFQAAEEIKIGSSADFVAVGDINNDKKPDLLVSTIGTNAGSSGTPSPGALSILLGNGDGSFQAAKVTPMDPSLDTPAFVALGDFNGDGNLDVASGNEVNLTCNIGGANCVGGNVLLFLGNGDGTFQTPVKSSVDFSPLYFATGDFNRDGKADLAIVGLKAFKSQPELPAVQQRVISVVLGNGDGTFGAPIGVAALPASVFGCHGAAAASNLVAADLNGDTKLDLILAVSDLFSACQGSPSSAVWSFLGNGDGTFQSAQPFSLTTQPYWLAVGDFSQDKLPDFTVSNPSSNNVSVFLNTGPSVTLSLTVAGNGIGMVAAPPTLYCPATCSQAFAPGTKVTLSASPNRLSEFSGWGGACSGTNASCTLTLSANESVTATFAAAPVSVLSVTLAGSGGGSVTSKPSGINCGTACSNSFITGTQVTLTAAPNASSNFTGWSGGCSGTTTCDVTLNAAASVTATFAPQDFSLTPASASLTLQPGGKQADVITIAGINGPFASTIQLTCAVAGPAPQPSCGLLQTSVMPGSNSVTSTLTVVAPMAAAMRLPFNHRQAGGFLFASWVALALLGIALAGAREKARSQQWALWGLLAILLMMQAGCGGGSTAPLAQTFTVTVTGASGATQHTAQVTVTLQ
jgi:hypothetical protein